MSGMNKKDPGPKSAKLVLIIFGLGPILIMTLFLYFNDFFSSPSF